MQVRNWNLDLAKALAMLLVVMQHAWSMLDLDNPELGLLCGGYRAVSTIGVPLFVFVSGALLLSRKSDSLLLFYKKRFIRLLIPFFLFALVMYVISLLMGKYEWWNGKIITAVLQFIPSLFENKINVMHWFVHMLLFLYLLTPFIQRILVTLSQREVEGILVVWIIGMLLKQYYPEMNILSYTSNLWRYLGIYIAGYYVNQYRVGKSFYCYVGLVVTLGLFVVNAITDCTVQLGVPFTALMIGLMCLNLPISDNVSQNIFGHIVMQISRYTYTIYLIHVLLISVIYLIIEKTYTDILINYIGIIPLIVSVLVMFVCYVICVCYDRIKCLPNKFIGIG